MNLQQLEYIIAVDTYRHFAKAAEKVFVTQPTLSMMIQKLEQELGVQIFDRSRQPVETTPEGREVVDRAKQIIADVNRLKEYTRELKHDVSGELKIAVIPTLAPYLLPLFLKNFVERHPEVKVHVRELVTNDIVTSLKNGTVDIGILATPLHEIKLEEHPVFFEEFLAYAAPGERVSRKKYVLPKDIDLRKLWLLEEGHCLRNQVFNLCELKKMDVASDRLHYEAGSIETLKNLVDNHKGITILPYLATLNFSSKKRLQIREFAQPKPVREISLVVNRNFARMNTLKALKHEIEISLPKGMNVGSKKKVMEVLK